LLRHVAEVNLWQCFLLLPPDTLHLVINRKTLLALTVNCDWLLRPARQSGRALPSPLPRKGLSQMVDASP
jgi:hypothetical protein